MNVPRLVIDARAVDDSGQPIADLSPADFAVSIDGRPARVDSMEWVPHVTPTDQPLAAASPTRVNSGRTIVFLYQKKPDLTEVTGLMRVRRDLAAFANVITPSDRAAVVSFDTHLHIWVDFTSNHDRIRRALEHDIISGTPPPRATAGPVGSVFARVAPEVQRESNTFEKALRTLGESLALLPGPKTIIILGYAMGTWMPTLGMVELGRRYVDAFEALQKARVSVFCIDLTAADYHPREEGLRLVAEDTGGFYAQSHIFTTAIFNRLAGALAGYYALLVVSPDDLKAGERRIDVTLVRRRGSVLARRRYSQP